MKGIVSHNLPVTSRALTGKKSIDERAIELARYIIDSKDTVRGAAKKFCICLRKTKKNKSKFSNAGKINTR